MRKDAVKRSVTNSDICIENKQTNTSVWLKEALEMNTRLLSLKRPTVEISINFRLNLKKKKENTPGRSHIKTTDFP